MKPSRSGESLGGYAVDDTSKRMCILTQSILYFDDGVGAAMPVRSNQRVTRVLVSTALLENMFRLPTENQIIGARSCLGAETGTFWIELDIIGPDVPESDFSIIETELIPEKVNIKITPTEPMQDLIYHDGGTPYAVRSVDSEQSHGRDKT